MNLTDFYNNIHIFNVSFYFLIVLNRLEFFGIEYITRNNYWIVWKILSI